MDPPPPPFASSSSSSSPSPSTSSSASLTMVIITVVGILAAFALLASYYAFVTKCQLLRAVWSRHPPWHRRTRGPGGIGRDEASSVASRPSATEGLGLPLIRMLPVVKFTAAACDAGGVAAPRISVSECAVCLSEFEERERVRLLPNCSHAFHIDCIDTWLQGSARCPFCRSDVSLPALPSARRALAAATAVSAGLPMRRDDALAGDSIVIEVRGDHERWFSSHGTTAAGARPATAGARGPRHPPPKQQQRSKAESVGDEAIGTRKTTDAEFAVVQPLRRSMSLDDSSCGKHLYVSIQELLATSQRQVRERDPSVHS